MCGLCGVLDHADHWSSGAPDPLFAARPVAERQRQAAAANVVLAVYGLTLSSWGGRYILRSRTGRSAVVGNLGALWAEAERLSGRSCDPLDPALLAALEARR